MGDDEIDARLDAAIDELAAVAREQYIATRTSHLNPEILDSVAMIQVSHNGASMLGCVTLAGLRRVMGHNDPGLIEAIDELAPTAVRIIAVGFGRWRVREEPFPR